MNYLRSRTRGEGRTLNRILSESLVGQRVPLRRWLNRGKAKIRFTAHGFAYWRELEGSQSNMEEDKMMS